MPSLEARKTLQWSEYPITFDESDCPMPAKSTGVLPLVCTPTVNNIAIGKTLIDGGAGLNVLVRRIFEKMQIPHENIKPTKPFVGVSSEVVFPIG